MTEDRGILPNLAEQTFQESRPIRSAGLAEGGLIDTTTAAVSGAFRPADGWTPERRCPPGPRIVAKPSEFQRGFVAHPEFLEGVD